MLYLFLFTFFVGVAEEVFFRGIIFNILRKYSIKKAALISAVIFGVFHLANLLGGQNTLYTLTQICYAFLFGLACSLIYYFTNSLVPIILWHFIHDFISISTGDVIDTKAIIILIIEVLILLIYNIYMLKNIKDDRLGLVK